MDATRVVVVFELVAIWCFVVVGAWRVTDLATAPFFEWRSRAKARLNEIELKKREAEFEKHCLAKIKKRVREELIEEYGLDEDGCEEPRLSDEAADVCAERLRRALDAMKRGDIKEARYEIEDAHEELAA